MKKTQFLILTIVVAGLMVALGLSGIRILFLQGPRSAAIALGIIGMLLCTISVGKFISAAPAHPLSILGYIIGSVAMLTFLAQVFAWKLPVIGDPKTALVVLALAMVAKSVIARFLHYVVK